MKLSQWFLLIAVAFVWGTSFTAIEIGLTEVNPTSVMFWRLLPAALLTLIIVYFFGLKYPRDLRFWVLCAITGAFNSSIPFVLIASGQQHIGAGVSATLNSAVPISTAILAHIFLRNERLNPLKILGLVLGVTGIMIIFGLESLQNFSLRSLGQLMVLGATFCYALGFIFGKEIIRTAKYSDMGEVHPFVICSSSMVWGAIWMIPLVYLVDGELQTPQSAEVWFPLMFMSIFGTGIAYMVYYHLLARVEAIKVAMVTFIIPPIAIIVSWISLGEVLTTNTYIGMAVIFVALMCLDGNIKGLFVKKVPSPPN